MRLVLNSCTNVTVDHDEKLSAERARTHPDEILSEVVVESAWSTVTITAYRSGATLTQVKPSDPAAIREGSGSVWVAPPQF